VLDESWRDAELRDICSSITDGDHLPPPKQANGVPFLTIGNISSGRLDFSQTRFVSESYFANIKPERVPRRGDTLYTVVGATIGIPVLVDTDRQFCFQRHIAILKPSKATSPEFLRKLMASPIVFREAWARITGTAQPTLPLGNLRTIPVSVPPLTEQQEIVRRVEGLFALADQLELRLAKARGQVDKLTPSLLARAFRGELVPQNPNDEPASVLLERIKVRQNGREPNKRKAKRAALATV
jgi:type I restriction enzyme, S subunit